jgi:steroid 5-alpha reductase family enzyme
MDLPWSQAWASLVVLAVVMAVAWQVLGRLGRRGHVDLLWGVAIGIQAAIYATIAPGWGPRRIAVATVAGFWALRLAWHLAQRLGRDGEDGRYLAMEEAVGERKELFFFGFFQLQALAAWIFALPFLALVQDATPSWRAAEIVGLALWLVALLGNGLADRQLDRWRRDPANRGVTCRAGMWGWSRHPNYFFEWLLWCAYPVAAIGTPQLWLNVGVAAFMYLMITRVSGIPFTEQQALRSRGDDYRAYQASTSSFFPLPPRHVAHD